MRVKKKALHAKKAAKEEIFFFIESKKGFFIGYEPAGFGGVEYEPAGFGGVEGDPMWDKDPTKAKGFLESQWHVDLNLEGIPKDPTCRNLKIWQTNLTEAEIVVYEVMAS